LLPLLLPHPTALLQMQGACCAWPAAWTLNQDPSPPLLLLLPEPLLVGLQLQQ
jgi:hypothetical protein